MPLPVALIFITNASVEPPPKCGWNAVGVIGNGGAVLIVTVPLPLGWAAGGSNYERTRSGGEHDE